MSTEPVRVGPDWLALREPADAAARSDELVAELLPALAPPVGGRPLVVHDLGSGSGSMARWLAPRLPGPQHWVLHDRDAALLDLAAADAPTTAADGSPVTCDTRHGDVTRLGELEGAGLVTASALLDMLTAGELERLVDSCAGAHCPVLVALSVVGRVELTPAEPLDRRLAEAFDAHQRRVVGPERLLGPDAPDVAAEAFRRRGYDVRLRGSPWRLGPAEAALSEEWFAGWLGAACEQEPGLHAETEGYASRRRALLRAGRLEVVVHHEDLLALPR